MGRPDIKPGRPVLLVDADQRSSDLHMERYWLTYPPPKKTQWPAIGYSCHNVWRYCHPVFYGWSD